MKLIDKILNIPLYKKHYLIVYITREGIGQKEISITKRIRTIFLNDLQDEIFNIRKFVIVEENIKIEDVAILNAIKTGMTFKLRGNL